MPTKLTDVAKLKAFYTASPTAIPLNNARDLSWTEGNPNYGQGPGDSSKICPVSSDGKLIMARSSNAYYAIYDTATQECRGSIPLSIYNGMPTGCNPRWMRFGSPDWIVFTVGTEVRVRLWNNLNMTETIATAPTGYQFIDCGGDGDVGDDGRYYPVMISTGYANGFWQNVKVGVCDLAGKKLSAFIPGKPDAIDISPDGKWLLWADGEGQAGTSLLAGPNRVYRVADIMFYPGFAVVNVPSAITNGVQSCGHNGWATLKDGRTAWVFQDNRDDYIKYWVPGEAECVNIVATKSMGYPNLHFSRHAPQGYTLVSSYGLQYPEYATPEWKALNTHIYLLELATGKPTLVSPTNTKWTPTNAKDGGEAPAMTNWVTATQAYWCSNNNGLDNLECWTEPIVVPTPPSLPTPRNLFEQDGRLWSNIGASKVEVLTR